VPVAGAAVAMAGCGLGLAAARLGRMPPRDAAVFGLQAGMGNVGYTLGGSLSFALWGLQGLALEQMYCLMWPFFAFLFCFPLARHYGEQAARDEGAGPAPGEEPSAGADRLRSGPPSAGPATDRPRGDEAGARRPRPGGSGPAGPAPSGPLAYALRTLARSLTDLRSLPLYLATLGLALNLGGVAPPAAVRRWHLIDALMVVGIFLQFGGVGMTVRAARLPAWWRPAVGTAALKMAACPLLALAVGPLLGLAGTPLWVTVLLAAMPSALYSVLMANLFGLNTDLASATFILTHVLCLAAVAVGGLAWNLGWLP